MEFLPLSKLRLKLAVELVLYESVQLGGSVSLKFHLCSLSHILHP